MGNLIDCVKYRTAEEFAASVEQHRNAPEWFRPEGLYGFVFQNLHPIAYHAYSGQTMIFTVSDFNPGG